MATAPRTARPLRTVVVVLLVAAAGIGGGVALVVGAGVVLTVLGLPLSPLTRVGLSLVLLTGVGFGGAAFGYLRYRGLGLDYVGVSMPSLRDLLAVVVGYVLALGIAMAAAAVVSLLGVEAGSNQAAALGAQHPEVLLLLIPAAFLFIGPGEELLFRGVIQSRLREAFGAVPAVVLASLLFAAIHVFALSGGGAARLVTVSILFLPSLVFGAVYELTRNIVVPATIHAAYNATLFALLYVAVRFSQLQPQAVEGGASLF